MEVLLRILSIVLLVLTVCLIGLDSQTKVIFFSITRKATFRDLNALYVLVWIDSGAAVYNLLQVFRYYGYRKDEATPSCRYMAWGVYLLDQAIVYAVFAAQTAALQASMLAITGEKSLQWMKVCNRYTKFCDQIGGALMCGYFATLLMAITSCISAYVLFRHYSPQQFLRLKKIWNVTTVAGDERQPYEDRILHQEIQIN